MRLKMERGSPRETFLVRHILRSCNYVTFAEARTLILKLTNWPAPLTRVLTRRYNEEALVLKYACQLCLKLMHLIDFKAIDFGR